MNDSAITKLKLIAELCETLREQSEKDSSARAAYQTTIDICTLLTALSIGPTTKLAQKVLNMRANALIDVWSAIITQHPAT